jgi:PAS domain S-box-containing protein
VPWSRGIFERAIDALLVVADGVITDANAAAAELLGEGAGALVAVSVDRVLGPGAAEIFTATGPQRGELSYQRGDRSLRLDWALSRDVAPGKHLLTLRDVTERSRREELWERYQLLSENAHDIVLFIRDNGTILEANEAAAHAYGYSREELSGLSVSKLRAPSTRDSVPQQMAEAFARGVVFETFHQRRDGSTFPVEVSSRTAAIGSEPVLLSIIRDLTERNQMQARLLQADRMAAVGTLAAGVAHEINNPLAYAITNLEVLERTLRRIESGSPEVLAAEIDSARQMLDIAREGVGRVRAIVRDLKTFSRADDLQRGPVDVRVVLDSCINMATAELRHRARIVRRYDEVPLVLASESRLAQVFLNLLVNAAQAFEHGSPDRNEIRVATSTDEEGQVLVEVADNGAGIPPALQARIFDPFVTTKPLGEGTGLGLFISREIVSGLGGSIRAESDVGVGTRLCVTLPAAAATTPSAPPRRSPPPSARPARVLVIDDEDSIGTSVRRALEGESRVVVATSGREALALLEHDRAFDVILCDVIMPDLDGIAVHAEMVARDPELAKRFVFMTGGVLTSETRQFLASIPGRLLEKPFAIDDLRELLRRKVSG